jgi:hypothetical protein
MKVQKYLQVWSKIVRVFFLISSLSLSLSLFRFFFSTTKNKCIANTKLFSFFQLRNFVTGKKNLKQLWIEFEGVSANLFAVASISKGGKGGKKGKKKKKK